MSKIDEQFAHLFVEDDSIALFHELAYDFAFFVFDDQDLLKSDINITESD